VDDDLVEVACREFVELVTEYLEGALPPELERAVTGHLALCDPCVTYLEQVRGTTGLLRSLPAPALPPAARQELLDVWDRVHRTARPHLP
jgi:anti-sigma factor RsiW